jgi:hypothetical protein
MEFTKSLVQAPHHIFHPASRLVRRGVSKGEEDGRRQPALLAGHHQNGCKAVSGVAHPQGVEGSSRAGPGETLGSPLIPLAIRACF